MMKYVLIYLLFMNLIGFTIMGIDKSKARKQKWRIRESTLFIVAALGGSIGSITGMYTFSHKTKLTSFVVGMPLILIVQIVIIAVLYYTNSLFLL